MPKLYLGLRLETAQTVETTTDNVTWTPHVFPAGSVWHDPHDLLKEIQDLGGLLYLLDDEFGITVPNTIAASASGSDWGVRFTSAAVIDAYLGSPGTVWQPAPSTTISVCIFPNVVAVEAIIDCAWNERSVQTYRGGLAINGAGTGEGITQGEGPEIQAAVRLRVAATVLNDYRDLLTLIYQAAPWALFYDDTIGGSAFSTPPWTEQQHLLGWLAASEDTLELLPEFDLTDFWSHAFQARVVEVVNA